MIQVRVTFYCDPQELLNIAVNQSGLKVQEGINKTFQEKNIYTNGLKDEMYRSTGMEELLNVDTNLDMSKYITINYKKISFSEVDSSNAFIYLVPCEFDDEKFLEDFKKELEEKSEEQER